MGRLLRVTGPVLTGRNPGLSQSAWFVLASVIDLEPRMWPKIDQREGSPRHLMTGESSSLLLGMVECVAWNSNNHFLPRRKPVLEASPHRLPERLPEKQP